MVAEILDKTYFIAPEPLYISKLEEKIVSCLWDVPMENLSQKKYNFLSISLYESVILLCL